MSKKINVEFDERCVDILKKIHNIHRNSFINIAIMVMSKSEYYNVLSGKSLNFENADNLSIENIDDIDDKTKNEEENEKDEEYTDWSSF